MATTSTDVLVVGAGPVGSTMAIALRLLGVECVLVDRHPDVLDFPRGRGVTVRTMELMRRWGLHDRLVQVGLPNAQRAVYVGNRLLSPEFQRFELPTHVDTRESPVQPLLCEQNAMERVLRDAVAVSGADVRLGVEVTDVVERHDGVEATVVDRVSGEQHTIRASWLVAADGSHSPIRARLGIGCHGPGVVGEAVTVLFAAPLGERMLDRLSGLYRLNEVPGATVLCVDNDTRWALIYGYDPETEDRESFTEARCRALVDEAVGDDSVQTEVLGIRFWSSTAHVADRYREGRTFLVGDAAHVTTPIGGLGMNCGLADVDNLAWKLAAVVAGWAGEPLLDTYEAERMPVAEQSAEASLGRARPPASVVGLVLGASYSSTAVLADGTLPPHTDDPIGEYVPVARPGHRAPHIWLDDDHTCSTLDLFGTTMVLLVAPGGAAWREQARGIVGVPVDVHEIEHPEWSEVYGVDGDGAVLVRPDGFVAWRSKRGPASPDAFGVLMRELIGASDIPTT